MPSFVLRRRIRCRDCPPSILPQFSSPPFFSPDVSVPVKEFVLPVPSSPFSPISRNWQLFQQFMQAQGPPIPGGEGLFSQSSGFHSPRKPGQAPSASWQHKELVDLSIRGLSPVSFPLKTSSSPGTRSPDPACNSRPPVSFVMFPFSGGQLQKFREVLCSQISPSFFPSFALIFRMVPGIILVRRTLNA